MEARNMTFEERCDKERVSGRGTSPEQGQWYAPGEYEKEMEERLERSRRSDEREQRTRELHRVEVLKNFDKAASMLSRQVGVDEKGLRDLLFEAMGNEMKTEKVEQTTALIHGYHPVVRLLEQLRNANKITDNNGNLRAGRR